MKTTLTLCDVCRTDISGDVTGDVYQQGADLGPGFVLYERRNYRGRLHVEVCSWECLAAVAANPEEWREQ